MQWGRLQKPGRPRCVCAHMQGTPGRGTGPSHTSSLVPAALGPTSQPPTQGGGCHTHLGGRGGKMGSHDPAFQEAQQ